MQMNRKSKSLLTLASAMLVAMATYAKVPDEGLAFCSCHEGSVYNDELPMSHPINRCAAEQTSVISWSSWFAGNSRSSQFHYLDLLELLSRTHSDNAQNKTPTS